MAESSQEEALKTLEEAFKDRLKRRPVRAEGPASDDIGDHTAAER